MVAETADVSPVLALRLQTILEDVDSYSFNIGSNHGLHRRRLGQTASPQRDPTHRTNPSNTRLEWYNGGDPIQGRRRNAGLWQLLGLMHLRLPFPRGTGSVRNALLNQVCGIIDFARQTFNGLPMCSNKPAIIDGTVAPSIHLINARRGNKECRNTETNVFTILVRSIAYLNTATPNAVDPSVFNLNEYRDVVRDTLPPGLPPHRAIQHSIDVIPGSKPKSRGPHRLTYDEKQELTRQIDDLLSQGLICPASSPYGAPILFVRKKDGSRRLCVDYRALYEDTIKERFRLPLIDDIFDTLAGSRIFSSLDLHPGYHQMRVADRDIYKTAFVTPYDQYAWRVMPFGLTNAPATFQYLMNDILRPMLNRSVVIYLDDILVFSKSEEEHKVHLRQALEILRANKLVAKAKKCFFFSDRTSVSWSRS